MGFDFPVRWPHQELKASAHRAPCVLIAVCRWRTFFFTGRVGLAVWRCRYSAERCLAAFVAILLGNVSSVRDINREGAFDFSERGLKYDVEEQERSEERFLQLLLAPNFVFFLPRFTTNMSPPTMYTAYGFTACGTLPPLVSAGPQQNVLTFVRRTLLQP